MPKFFVRESETEFVVETYNRPASNFEQITLASSDPEASPLYTMHFTGTVPLELAEGQDLKSLYGKRFHLYNDEFEDFSCCIGADSFVYYSDFRHKTDNR